MPDLDPEKFLRDRGVEPRNPEAPPPLPTAPAETTTAPSREEVEQSWYHKAGKGVMQGLGRVARSAADLAPYASPLTTGFAPELGELIQQHPYYQDVKQFSEEPSESNWQTAGQVGGEVLGTAAIPGFGVEAGAARLLSPTLGRLAPYAARLAGRATKGAVGGAIGDPEHPGRAAAGGAAAGLLPGAGGAGFRSRAMRSLGGLFAVE